MSYSLRSLILALTIAIVPVPTRPNILVAQDNSLAPDEDPEEFFQRVIIGAVDKKNAELARQGASQIAIGSKVTIPLEDGAPSDIGLGVRHRAEVANVDGQFVDVTYIWNGTQKRAKVLKAFVQSAFRADCEKGRLKGHAAEVTSISFSHDGTTLASTSPLKGGVKIWDLAKMTVQREISTHRFGSNGVVTLLEGGGLVAHCDKELFLWADASTPSEPITFSEEARGFAISPDGKVLALIEAGQGKERGPTMLVSAIAIKDIFAKAEKLPYRGLDLDGDLALTNRIVVSDKGNFILLACCPKDNLSKSELTAWSVGEWKLDGKAFPSLAGDALALSHFDEIGRSKQSSLFVHGNELCEFDYPAVQPIEIVEPEVIVRAKLAGMSEAAGRNMTCAAFAPDNSWLVTTHRGGEMMFFDTKDGRQLSSFPASEKDVRTLAVAPDGRSIATADGAEIVIWSVPKILGTEDKQ
jgi:WD40 repeat protein